MAQFPAIYTPTASGEHGEIRDGGVLLGHSVARGGLVAVYPPSGRMGGPYLSVEAAHDALLTMASRNREREMGPVREAQQRGRGVRRRG